MSNGKNPFDALVAPGPKQSEIPDNPFDALVGFEPRRVLVSQEPDVGAGEAFRAGVVSGFLTPTNIFTGEVAGGGLELDEGSEIIANLMGNLVGFGISWFPIARGTSLALKGIGLTKVLGDRAFRAVANTIATGLFEVGAETQLEEAPKAFARGAAFGGAIEGLLFLGALRNRGRLPLTLKGTAPNGTKIAVNADALAIEQALDVQGSRSLDELVDKLAAIGPEEAQLDDVLGRVMQTYRPGGWGIIPQVREPQKLVQSLSRLNPELQSVIAPTGEGLHELMIFDPSTNGRLVRLAKAAATRKKTIREYLGGGDKRLSPEEAIELIRRDVPGEKIGVIPDIKMGERADFVRQGDLLTLHGPQKSEALFAAGGYSFTPGRGGSRPTIRIYTDKERPALERLSAIVHEYTHHITSVPGQLLKNITDVFKFKPGTTARELSQYEAKVLDPRNLPPLLNEFKNAQIETIKQFFGRTHEEALAKVNGSWSTYFGTEPELMAWLVQLMALDPATARRVAPRASRLMSRLISRESPKLEMMLTSESEVLAFDDLVNARWITDVEGKTKFFRESPVRFNPRKAAREFRSNGFVSGMTVEYRGRLLEATGGSWRAAEGQVRLFDPETKTRFAVNADEVSRPLLPRMAQASAQVQERLSRLLKAQEDWIGFSVLTPSGEGIQRGIVNLEDFPRAQSFVEYVRANREQVLKGRKLSDIEDMRGAVLDHLKESGQPGIIIEESGIPLEIHVVDQSRVQLGEILSTNFNKPLDLSSVRAEQGGFVLDSFVPSFQNRVESLLRASGVDSREIEYFMPMAEREFAKIVDDVLEDEFRALKLRIQPNQIRQLALPMDLESVAAKAGLNIDRTINGQVRVMATDGLELGRFRREVDAQRFISRVGRGLANDLDAGAPVPGGSSGYSGGLGGPPPRVQAQLPTPSGDDLTKVRNAFASITLGMAHLSPLKAISQAIENLGLGAAWTKVFQPTQLALREVDRLLGHVPRPRLNGETFKHATERLSRMTAKLSRERKELVTRALEFRTKEEIARAGGILSRAMSPAEIRLADEIERFGRADDIPALAGKAARVEINLREARKAAKGELGLKGEMLEGYMDEVRKRVLSQQGASGEELQIIERILNLPKESSLLAIARYAAAPKLERGFKSGRDMFLAQNEFNGLERKIVQEMDGLFDEIFFESGFSRDQMLGGFWPIARQFIKNGLPVGAGQESVAGRLYSHIPEGTKWVGRRLMSGGLDPYELEPGLYAYRHARNMAMAQHFDPILQGVREEIQLIAAADKRAGRIMGEYLNELVGVQHQQFKRLQETMQRVASGFGVELSDDLSEKFVNTLSKLAHQAAIPWRGALILRNYMQTIQFTIPIVGPRAWAIGLSEAMTKEGFLAAVKAGAVDINVVPTFASTEILGGRVIKVSEKLGPLAAQAGAGWEALMNRGFDWYRHADDVGRAIAYHAGKHRVRQATHLWAKGGDLEAFKRAAKVKTFNETVEREFDRLVLSGDLEAASDLIGVQLAEKAHFLYGHANHPAGWGGVYGRLLGQFGTFPVQYAQTMFEGLTRGTLKDRAEWLVGHVGINAAIVGVGAEAFGLDLGSWSTIPSLHYSGGPYADMLVNLVNFWGGTEQERSVAAENLKYMFPTFSSPQSIFVPGSYFLGDLADAIEAPAGQEFGEFLGFRFLRPNDDNWLQKALGWAY